MKILVIGCASAGLVAAICSTTLSPDIIVVDKVIESGPSLHSFEQVLLAQISSDINQLEAIIASGNEYVLYDLFRASGLFALSNANTELISNIVCCKHKVRQSQHPP